jgi:hypothetical protein
MSISINEKAYSKIMLHCLKHTSNDCFGILLGTSSNGTTEITDTIPLSHDKLFAPQTELCLKFIENYMQGSKVIGLYENLLLNKEKEVLTVSNTVSYLGECFAKAGIEGNILFEISSLEKVDEVSKRLKDEIVFKVCGFHKV